MSNNHFKEYNLISKYIHDIIYTYHILNVFFITTVSLYYSICYKQTRCWQCTAISTASEANTTASESAELGSPLDRRRHEIKPGYTAADEVALAGDSSASGSHRATHKASME